MERDSCLDYGAMSSFCTATVELFFGHRRLCQPEHSGMNPG